MITSISNDLPTDTLTDPITREIYFGRLSAFLNAADLCYVQKAYWLVKDAHREQFRRLTQERFFNHVRRVSLSAVYYGYTDVETITLGLLHDVVEDTNIPTQVLLDLFGSQMYRRIYTISKEIPAFNHITGRVVGRAKIPLPVYFSGLLAADAVVQRTKCLDRTDNLKDLEAWEPERRDRQVEETVHYILPIARQADSRLYHRIHELITPWMTQAQTDRARI